MRNFVVSLAAAGCLAATSAVFAQQVGGNIAADHKDVGKLQTRVQKYDQALGVISQLGRSPGSDAECYGVCFFPNSSKSVSWKCEPDRKCDLHCTVNPPVGGCN